MKLTPVRRRKDAINDRMRRFCVEYASNGYDQKAAALAAGYSEKSASVSACILMRKPEIRREIAKIERDTFERLELKRDDILLQLYDCVTRNAGDFCDETGKIVTDVSKLSRRARNVIDGIEQDVHQQFDKDGNVVGETIKTKLRLVPKTGAIDMAMKHKGLFAPTLVQGEAKVAIDWDAMTKLASEPDVIEERLIEEEKVIDVGEQP